MTEVSNALFLMPYLLASLAFAGVLAGWPWSLFGVAVLFLIHPLLDAAFGRASEAETTQASGRLMNFFLLTYPPFQTVALVLLLASLPGSGWTAGELVSAAVSTGVITGGFGITAAHELIHRRNRSERALGVWLLALVNYSHFRIEHVHGHHVHVATPRDPATARRGEWLPLFWFRSIAGGLVGAWRIERGRLARRPAAQRILRNRIIHFGLIALLLAGSIGVTLGPQALAFFWIQSAVAILLLETINYVEHYGLRRPEVRPGVFAPVKEAHSWDSCHRMTNWVLFNLGKHAHHHYAPTVPYWRLEEKPAAPQLPLGYSSMVLLALVPPLFFAIMNPRVDRARGSH